MPFGNFGVLTDTGTGSVKLGGEGKGLLLSTIVEVAGEAVALLGHGQLVELPLGLTQLGKQPLVLPTRQLYLAQGVAVDAGEDERAGVEQDVDQCALATQEKCRSGAYDE